MKWLGLLVALVAIYWLTRPSSSPSTEVTPQWKETGKGGAAMVGVFGLDWG